MLFTVAPVISPADVQTIIINVTKDVESLFTPVALGLVTDRTLFVLTRSTHHGVVHTVGPIWTGLMTVCAQPDKQKDRNMDIINMTTYEYRGEIQ